MEQFSIASIEFAEGALSVEAEEAQADLSGRWDRDTMHGGPQMSPRIRPYALSRAQARRKLRWLFGLIVTAPFVGCRIAGHRQVEASTPPAETDTKGLASALPPFRALASAPEQLSGNVWLTATAYSDSNVASTVHLLVHATNRGSDTARVMVGGCPRIVHMYRERSGVRDLLWSFGEGTPLYCRLVKYPVQVPPGCKVVLPGWPDVIDLNSVELGSLERGRYLISVRARLLDPRAQSSELVAGESLVQ